MPLNAIAERRCERIRELARRSARRSREVASVTTVDLGAVHGVPFGFTDAVALDDERIVVLACAEDSASAISDGAVLGCRVGLLDDAGLTTADVHDATGSPTLLKLEGIERRPGSSTEFDVAVDVDRPDARRRCWGGSFGSGVANGAAGAARAVRRAAEGQRAAVRFSRFLPSAPRGGGS